MNKEDVVNIYNGDLLSHKKRSETVPFAEKWMDLETVIQNEVSQKDNFLLITVCMLYLFLYF